MAQCVRRLLAFGTLSRLSRAHEQGGITAARSRLRLPTFAQRALLASGLLMPLIGAVVAFWPEDARAATVYCGTRSSSGSAGGISYSVYIDVYADPVCSNDGINNDYRYLAYDFYSTSSSFIDHHYIDYLRAWICGQIALNEPSVYFYNANWTNKWSGWSTWNYCGFQADEQVWFYEAGVVNAWKNTSW